MSFSQDTFRQLATALGRSEDFIQEALDYAGKLTANNKPVIFSTYHLSVLSGIRYAELIYLIEHRTKYYKYYRIAKKRGGSRAIISPYKI